MNTRAMAAVLGIFTLAALTNLLAANEIQNAKCRHETCTAASQRCVGSGSCTYCMGSGGNDKGFCGVAVNSTCANAGNTECGVIASGTCYEGICTGTAGSGTCFVPKCTPPAPQ